MPYRLVGDCHFKEKIRWRSLYLKSLFRGAKTIIYSFLPFDAQHGLSANISFFAGFSAMDFKEVILKNDFLKKLV